MRCNQPASADQMPTLSMNMVVSEWLNHQVNDGLTKWMELKAGWCEPQKCFHVFHNSWCGEKLCLWKHFANHKMTAHMLVMIMGILNYCRCAWALKTILFFTMKWDQFRMSFLCWKQNPRAALEYQHTPGYSLLFGLHWLLSTHIYTPPSI